MRLQRCACGLPVILLCALAVVPWVAICSELDPSSVEPKCSEHRSPPGNAKGNLILKCEGVDLWRIPYAWKPLLLSVNCAKASKCSIFAGHDDSNLFTLQNEVQGCGKGASLGHVSCLTKLSPYKAIFAGVRCEGASSLNDCTHTNDLSVSINLIIFSLVGLFLFLLSGNLTRLTALRAVGGATLIVLTSPLIAAFLIARCAPRGTGIFVLLLLLGGGSFAIFEMVWVDGLPSFTNPIWNKTLMAYVVLSGAAGFASMYRLDDPTNNMMTHGVRAGLQLLGLAFIFVGLLHWAIAAIVAVILLLGDYAVRPAGMWVLRKCYTRVETEPSCEEEQASDMDTPVRKDLALQDEVTEVGRRAGNVNRVGVTLRKRMVSVSESSEDSEWKDKLRTGAFNEFNEWTPQVDRKPVTPATETPPSKIIGGVGLVEDGDDVNPIVQEGRILNPLSGRTIQIGKQRYKDLVEQGYTPNFKEGVLDRPSKRVV